MNKRQRSKVANLIRKGYVVESRVGGVAVLTRPDGLSQQVSPDGRNWASREEKAAE